MLKSIKMFLVGSILSFYCLILFKDKEMRKLKKMKTILLVDSYCNGEISREELSESLNFQLGIK